MMFTAINTKTIEYDENIYIKYLLMKKIITYKLSNKNSIKCSFMVMSRFEPTINQKNNLIQIYYFEPDIYIIPPNLDIIFVFSNSLKNLR